MKRFVFTIAATMIFSSVVFVPLASASQRCADGYRSSSNKGDACVKHGGQVDTSSKTKPTTNSLPVTATIPEPISMSEPSGSTKGNIPGLCSRINRYALGTC